MKETFVVVGGLILQIVVGFAPLYLWKFALVSKSALGRLAGNINNSTKGLTNRAKEKAEGSDYYQRRQFAAEARKQERRRGNVEDYATRVSGEGWRARALRRRAAGGFTGQLLGAVSGDRLGANAAGQQRIGQAAEDQLRKQRQEEAQRALQRMTRTGIEGDNDLEAIAMMTGGGEFVQTRRNAANELVPTGVRMQVGVAEQQAAMNALAQQGRVGPLRHLEDPAHNGGQQARGVGGQPLTDYHRMLDEAYQEYGAKLGDKAPDLLPNRRATQGIAAFTDLQPADVAGWHHSTVTAARNFFNTPRTENYIDQNGQPAQRPANTNAEREQMLRALAEATRNPATRSKLSIDQMRQAQAVLTDARAAGFADGVTINAIENTYRQMGGV